MSEFELLVYLAGKLDGTGSSTGKISRETGLSQQTISRKLIEMEKKGLVKRTVSPLGTKIDITEKGFSLLREKYCLLSRIFKKEKIRGKVKNGVGEGSFYIKKYSKKINSALGFVSYPGTLNIELDKKSKSALLKQNPLVISGFKTKERTYGSINCYKAKINRTKAAIIIPERTRHPDNIIEVISPVCLRAKFNLKDNDLVEVEL